MNQVTPCYYSLDCIPAVDGRLQVVDVCGSVGRGLALLEAAYGGRTAARSRLRPYLERLGQLADGGLILFIHDTFVSGQTFPDDFFELAQRFAPYSPITDWVPDLQHLRRQQADSELTAGVEQMGMLLEPLAARLRLKLAYGSAARVDEHEGGAMLLLSGYRERARGRGTSVIRRPEEIGVVVFSGASERFPDDLRGWSWCPIVNPPLLDQLLEHRWLLPLLLEGTPAVRLLPRWIPAGMGMRTAAEVREFIDTLPAPNGFPLAVLKPSLAQLSPGVRFLDRTALRALAARQPERRLSHRLAEELLAPRIAHSYEEISGYRGKVLDNLLRTPGAEVHDHGDGTFHYSAPYPFLQSTVAVLQEYVESRPIRARRTGKFHRGSLRVVMFDGRIVTAVYHLASEPDDGTFRDLSRPEVRTFVEGAAPEEEAEFQAQLGPFVEELERQFAAQVRGTEDLAGLRERWIRIHSAGE